MRGPDCFARALPYAWGVLLVLAGTFLLSGLPEQGLAADVSSAAVSEVKPSLKTVDIPVEGMQCVACAAKVKSAVKSLDGVSRVEVSLGKRTARITYATDRLSPDRIVAAIDNAGYKAGSPREAE